MTNVEDIERAVERLEGADFARFRDWFARLEADRFDQAIEADIEAGRLDKLLEEALANLEAGRTTPLRGIGPHDAFGRPITLYRSLPERSPIGTSSS